MVLSTGIYKYVYMGNTVDLFFCNVYTVWMFYPCFSFLSQSKDIYCSLIGTFLLCVYTTHPVYPALCQVSPGNIGPRLPVTLCRISSYKVHISITSIIHQFWFFPPSDYFGHLSFKYPVSKQSFMVQIVSEWLSGLLCCSVLGIEYASFNPSSFLKPLRAGIKGIKKPWDNERNRNSRLRGFVGTFRAQEQTRAMSRDMLSLDLPVKREIKTLAVLWIKIDCILFCKNYLTLCENNMMKRTRTIFLYNFYKQREATG